MQVLGEPLAPGVQHHRDADSAAQPARVLAEFEERCTSGVKEQPVDHARIALGEGIEFMGQGEHDVEIGHRQELRLPGSKPTLLGQGLTLRAVPVAAGVIGIAQLPALIAAGNVAAQCRSAAGLNGVQRPMLHRGEAVRGAIGRAVAGENLREFYPSCRIRTVRMRPHGALAAWGLRLRQQLQRRGCAREVLLREMKVTRCGAQTVVAHEPLDGVHVHSRLQHMSGKGVA